MKIKDFKTFENKEDIDPYGEEKWEGEPTYNGNIIEFLKSIDDNDVQEWLTDMLGSDDLDERMDLAEQILSYVEEEYPDLYDEVEDDIRDLAIA